MNLREWVINVQAGRREQTLKECRKAFGKTSQGRKREKKPGGEKWDPRCVTTGRVVFQIWGDVASAPKKKKRPQTFFERPKKSAPSPFEMGLHPSKTRHQGKGGGVVFVSITGEKAGIKDLRISINSCFGVLGLLGSEWSRSSCVKKLTELFPGPTNGR